MNLLLRLLRVLIATRFRGRIDVLEESVLNLVVWPTDLDLNLHMNNGRYLSVMDLGRVDHVARTGLLRLIVRNRWQPVLGTATIRYRRSLRLFQRYRLITRVVCWDEKWAYMEQRFERDGHLMAQAYVKALFRTGRRTLRSREVLNALGRMQRSPAMPPVIEALRLAEGLTGEKPGRR